ncbi:MAG: type II toxin-antitoxin system HicA family toxin [Candidatus Gracilibacteria bacterium]
MVKILQKVGFLKVSQKGSHIKLKRKTNGNTTIVIVPNHKELTPGTLRNIVKTANLTLEDFDR